jgi:hypothetical protein
MSGFPRFPVGLATVDEARQFSDKLRIWAGSVGSYLFLFTLEGGG